MSQPPPAAAQESRTPATVAWVSSTYFAEGLPYSIVHQVASQFFTAMHASLESIGLVSLYGLAWNLKFAWSPVVDLVGTARKWLIVLQVLIGLAVGWIAWPAQGGDLQQVARVLVVVAVLAATHDIAIDGYYLRALAHRQQAAYAGLRIAAYRVALLVGNGGLVLLAGKVSWKAAFLAGGVIMLALALFHRLVLTRRDEAPPPEAPTVATSSMPRFAEAFLSFFRQPGIALALCFIGLYRLGDAMMFSMSTPLLRDLGLSTAMRGIVSGMVGTAVGIAGSMAAAVWISRATLKRTLFWIAIVQAAALPLYALISWLRPPLPVVVVAVLAEQLAAGVGTAGFSVYLMRLCAGQYKAAHFAIATALMSVAATGSGAASGYIAKAMGFTAFFWLASLAAVPGVALARLVAHRLR